jgi:hypothetical protein
MPYLINNVNILNIKWNDGGKNIDSVYYAEAQYKKTFEEVPAKSIYQPDTRLF